MYLRDQSVRNTVTEGDEDNGDERWESITNVVPVDGGDLADHQAANL